MQIGERIARARKAVNLTQDQLAALLDVTRQTVSKWESDLALPETAKLPKLAEALQTDLNSLLTEGKTPAIVMQPTPNGGYDIDWTQVCPILATYQQEVDCAAYEETFRNIMLEIKARYHYSMEDAMLVAKDLLYQSYLKLQKEPE
ncbi:helix-turn-helix transcriptional regulator [Clostridium sp. D33t1_170424_F3]|uniref:helix-turn-helix domain-containing protein n=1 Tax=Clostridium sp. D33t1_170424_F3 TaxID=2787099 RepID=UPI0018ABC8D4|nr:helix-turn-helix transcriptional regulator [Clostridium sp. D33t1_170424_F3]